MGAAVNPRDEVVNQMVRAGKPESKPPVMGAKHLGDDTLKMVLSKSVRSRSFRKLMQHLKNVVLIIFLSSFGGVNGSNYSAEQLKKIQARATELVVSYHRFPASNATKADKLGFLARNVFFKE